MIYWFCRFLCGVLVKYYLRLSVKGRENLHKVKGGAIYAVNHTSYLDPMIAGVASDRVVYYMARKSLYRHKYFGALLRRVNTVPLDRDSADLKALRQMMKLLKEGNLVLMFPEGTRSLDGNFLPARPGVGLMALRMKVPVIPAYVKGSHDSLPKHAKFPRFVKVGIIIGEPIYFDKWLTKKTFEKSDYQEVADLVMDKIKELSKQI